MVENINQKIFDDQVTKQENCHTIPYMGSDSNDEYQDGYSIYQNDEGYFIVFIDILGFKNKIKNKSVKELDELMSGFIESSSAVISGYVSEDDQGNLFLDWNTRGIRAMFISD